MKNIFKQIEFQGKSYSVIVATKFGTQLSSASGDMVFHTSSIYNSAIDTLNTRGKENQFRKLSSKRRK